MKFRWRFLSVGLLALIILGLPSLAASQTAIVNGVSYLVPKQARLESSIIVGSGASRIITDKKNYS
jgi:hypothetical protein